MITGCAWFDHSAIKCNISCLYQFMFLLIVLGADPLEGWGVESESESEPLGLCSKVWYYVFSMI